MKKPNNHLTVLDRVPLTKIATTPWPKGWPDLRAELRLLYEEARVTQWYDLGGREGLGRLHVARVPRKKGEYVALPRSMAMRSWLNSKIKKGTDIVMVDVEIHETLDWDEELYAIALEFRNGLKHAAKVLGPLIDEMNKQPRRFKYGRGMRQDQIASCIGISRSNLQDYRKDEAINWAVTRLIAGPDAPPDESPPLTKRTGKRTKKVRQAPPAPTETEVDTGSEEAASTTPAETKGGSRSSKKSAAKAKAAGKPARKPKKKRKASGDAVKRTGKQAASTSNDESVTGTEDAPVKAPTRRRRTRKRSNSTNKPSPSATSATRKKATGKPGNALEIQLSLSVEPDETTEGDRP